MKNSKKLLLTAAFVAIMPTTPLLCEDEAIETSTTEATSTQTTEPVEITTQDKIKSAINDVTNTITENKNLLMNLSYIAGWTGLFAGAQGSHSLKAPKRALALNKDLSATELKYDVNKLLNKGIRNNRILMATSCAMMLPLPIYTFNETANGRDSAFTKVNLNETIIAERK